MTEPDAPLPPILPPAEPVFEAAPEADTASRRRLKIRTLARIAAALQMLTRFRLFQDRAWPADIYREAILWFPAIGILVGTLGAAVDGLGIMAGLTPDVTGPLAVAAMVWMTGGRHEGGLANLADGLGGSTDADGQLRIMQDSRIGTYGTLAVALMLFTRIGALNSFSSSGVVFAGLISASAFSRMLMALIASWIDPVDPDSDVAVLRHPPGLRLLAGLAFAALLPVILVDPITGLAMDAAGAAGAFAIAALARQQLRGYTRDVLSAVQQCSELAMLITLVAAQD